MSKELIRLRDLCMAFDDELVLDNINLYINDKEFCKFIKIIQAWLSPIATSLAYSTC